MKKTLLLILSAVLFVNAAIYLIIFLKPYYKKETIYIAAAGPLTDPRGKTILEGLELYRDKTNREGGIEGRKIELLFFDDKDKAEHAESIAEKIAEENKALLVLGHYRDDPSLAAGKIYKREGIPAITASATAESVTYDNEWFFRVIPVNSMEGEFAANYIFRSMKKKTADMVFTTDSYGQSIAGNFEKTARSLGMEIKNKWAWNREENPGKQAETVISDLKTKDKGDILFLAAHSAEGAELITRLKDAEIRGSVLGSYAFARNFFIELKKYPREQSEPGYYSDGIYFLTPFIADIGGIETYRFKQEFMKAYHEPPTDISACYYDAFHVAVQAIKKAGIHGGAGHRREDRRKIRAALSGFYSKETAVKGVTGPIYFDENGDVRKSYAAGMWWTQKRIPAFSQYQQTEGSLTADETVVRAILDGDILLIKDTVMNKIRVTYAGIDHISLGVPDIRHSECDMEFDIRFSYMGSFDDADIEFTNAVNPIILGKPVKEETERNIISRTYHVKGKFRYDFDFRTYPFDRQVIPVRFRHASMTDERMIYFPDILNMPRIRNRSIPGWDIGGISLYQDVSVKDSNLGNPKFFDSPHLISYSQFNAEVEIRRKNDFSVFVYAIPLAVILILLYGIYFIGPDRLLSRIIILMFTLTVTVGLGLIPLQEFSTGYLIASDYAFLMIYGLILLSAPLSVYIYRLHRKGKDRKVKFLLYAGRIAYLPLVFAMGMGWLYL